MLKSHLVSLSIPEANLVDTIQFVQYGELFGVEVASESPDRYAVPTVKALSPAMRDLIQYIREGCQYIDVLTIHNGQPACAETDFKMNEFRCRKRVRFPIR